MNSMRPFRKLLRMAIVFSMLIAGAAIAQQSETPFFMATYEMESGLKSAPMTAEKPVLVFSDDVYVPKIPWLRVFFENVALGENSYLQLTALADGARQTLTARTIAEWENASAFFNGDRIRIELFAAPGDIDVRFSVKDVMVGEWVGNVPLPMSICGADDDRIPSDDPKSGRIVPIGCTGWIISNGLQLTAGHCLDATTAQVLEFNVPMSLPDGTVQHPAPEFQYTIIQSSRVFVNGGVGNDWGKFEVQNNSETGEQPIQAQGESFEFVQDYSPAEIRITGYGVDGPAPGHGNGPRDETNQTEQTHVGPNMGSSGTTMRYHTDTQGGNSGSPVIDEATGRVLGIHTHGGCSTGATSSNAGTSFFHPDLWEAINIADPEDPLPPTNITAFSDATTPTSIQIDWTAPTALVDGTPVFPTDFVIDILREGSLLNSINGTVETFTDEGLTTGQTYTYTLLTRLIANDSTSQEVSVSAVAGGIDALIWNPTLLASAQQIVDRAKNDPRGEISFSDAVAQLSKNSENVAAISDALNANGIVSLTVAELPVNLSNVDYLFVVLGHFSSNYVITAGSAEAATIEDFIANGGHVYMEGGDAWFWDPGNGGHNFGTTFGINGLSDGNSNGELTTITGAGITAGQDFSYNIGSDSYPDHISAIGTGAIIHSNTSPAFDCGIANAAQPGETRGNTVGVSFQFMDLVDGASPATKNELMATYLAFFGQTSEITQNMVLNKGWNMIASPAQMADSAVVTMFPSHVSGTLFSFNGAYVSETHLARSKGYWLRFDSTETVELTGTPLDAFTVILDAGWNMISGPSCEVATAQILDQDSVIIPGTFYSFDGSYSQSDTLKPGLGYWVRASDSGAVTISCTAPVAKIAALQKPDLSVFPAITISGENDIFQTLYIDSRLPEAVEKARFTLPPVAPKPLLDARFADDSYLSESSEQTIVLQAERYPLRLQMTNLGSAIFEISEMAGTAIIATHTLRDGDILQLANPAVKRLSIRKSGLESGVPVQFAVEQNYPNPFNPSTEIRFALPEQSDVRVEIYNAIGQKIATVMDAKLQPGYHQVRWDGKNQSGNSVASGIYFYRVSAGEFVAHKQMILMK